MNTRLLMVGSSIFLATLGIGCMFAPLELLSALGAPATDDLHVLVQLAGSLYLAFAITNWTAKGSMIGGIYARPLSLGNIVHFSSGALALLKHTFAHGVQPMLVSVMVGYIVFALCFGYLVFGLGAACVPRASE